MIEEGEESAAYFSDARVREALWTCGGCPDQYEGELWDGRSFYFRLRHGMVFLGLGWSADQAISGTPGVWRKLTDEDLGVFESTSRRDEVFTSMLDELAGADWVSDLP